jgi:hypothetical protein
MTNAQLPHVLHPSAAQFETDKGYYISNIRSFAAHRSTRRRALPQHAMRAE